MKAAEALTDYDFLLQANVAVPLQPPTSCYNTSRLLKLAIASLYDNNAKCKFRLLLLLRMLHYNRFFCLCFSRCESRAALSSDAPLGRWPSRAIALSCDMLLVGVGVPHIILVQVWVQFATHTDQTRAGVSALEFRFRPGRAYVYCISAFNSCSISKK